MIRAPYDAKYFRRFLWVSLLCVGYALWCCYDALVAYPAKGQVAVVYESLKEKFDEANPPQAETDLFDLDRSSNQKSWNQTWIAAAKENGWPPDHPEKTAKEINDDIGKQYFMMILCGIIGVPCLIKWYRARGTWIEGDHEVIRNSRGQELQIENIVSIDKSKWQEKGIAKIKYRTANGSAKTFVMDDFKYQREPMAKIMEIAERRLAD